MTGPSTGAELVQFFTARAKAAGIALEADDDVLLEQASATLELCNELQRSIDTDGAVLVSATGAAKINPASQEVRQQRTALAKLVALIGHRIDVASNGVRPAGVQPGSTRVPADAARRGNGPMRRKAVS